jgi:hypothetical protein
LTLPTGYVVTSINRDRGPGCTGTAPTLTCDTGFINPGATTHLWISGTVGQAGEQDLTATVSGFPEPELDRSDNTVALKLTAVQAVAGESSTAGPSTAPKAAKRAVLVKAPAIRGTAKVGSTLRRVAAVWSTPPTRVTYRWQLCSARSCTTIAHAGSPSLKVTKSFVGKSVRLVLIAVVNGKTTVRYTAKRRVRA